MGNRYFRLITILFFSLSIIFLLPCEHTVLGAQPQTPVHITAENSADGIVLGWSRVKGVKGYYIYKGSKRIKTIINPNQTTYTDCDATKNAGKYTYRISSFTLTDGRKCESKKSAPIIQYYLRPTCITSLIIDNFKADLKWSANSRCRGYEIQYSVYEDFRKYKELKTSKTEIKTDSLSSKKDYYFRIRTFITVDKTTYYSVWNNSCKVIAWNPGWKYAKNSKIHSASVVLYYSSSLERKDTVVCINAGHGTKGGESQNTLCHPDGSPKVTGGTAAIGSVKTMAVANGTDFPDGTPERAANLAVARTLKSKLLSAGYDVLMIREDDDVQLDNVARTVIANNNADCHISIHYDSTDLNKGAFYTGVPNISSYRTMEPVASNWTKHEKLGQSLISGIKKSGVKIYQNGRMEVDLTQTSYSTIASVAIEVGDKKTDRSKKSLEKLTDGILNGLQIFAKK